MIKDRDRERVIEGSGVDRPIRLEDKQLDRQRNFSIFFLCVFTFLISETCNALRINTALFNQSSFIHFKDKYFDARHYIYTFIIENKDRFKLTIDQSLLIIHSYNRINISKVRP